MADDKEYHSPIIGVPLINTLLANFGNMTLEDIKGTMLHDRPFPCPRCGSKGVIDKEYNAYPSGLPDSGWAWDMRVKTLLCPTCDGYGFTKKKMVPKVIPQEYEEEK